MGGGVPFWGFSGGWRERGFWVVSWDDWTVGRLLNVGFMVSKGPCLVAHVILEYQAMEAK